MKRSIKFYRKNENIIMHMLGFKSTINSGAGWIEKEDGENDCAVCQLKSTDAKSISIKNVDLRQLEMNALTAHKIPVFAIQFIQSGDIWLMVRPEDVDISNLIILKAEQDRDNFVKEMLSEQKEEKTEKSIDKENKILYNKRELEARKQFWKDRQEDIEKQEQIKKKVRKWKRS